MRLLSALLVAGLLATACRAGSGEDKWGQDTLVNYPAGQTRKTVPVQAGDTGDVTPIDVGCQCSDADPRDEATQAVTFDCFYQRMFQNCNQTYMFDANAELAPEGFCQISCSRCNCCQSAWDVIQGLGATRFVQAAEAASPSLKDLLQHPGFAATILVPSDAAFDAALAKYQGLLQQPAALQQLLKFHILPPEPVRRGLWTSPFLSLGPKLYTMADGPQTLTASKFALPAGTTWKGGLTGFTIQGPFNAATVTQSDVLACKSVITLVDSVLLPFDPATPPPADATAAASIVGAQGCAVQGNALITGQQLSSTRVGTIGGCFAACRSAAGCNAFQYCAFKGGCSQPAGAAMQSVQYGTCLLMTSPDVAAGRSPVFSQFSPMATPMASGWVLSGPAAAAPVQPVVQSQAGAPAGGRRMQAWP